MVSWPIPKKIKQLRSFLGLTGYYQKFIQNYNILSTRLTDLLKRNALKWTMVAEKAFVQLRKVMSKAPVLALLDFSKPFAVETDASGSGMGAFLQQEGHLIAFISQAFGPNTSSLSAYERKLLAITFVVSQWRHYLEQGLFFIKTDYESIKHLLEQKPHTSLQLKGISKLLGLQYKILYRKGVENKVADALSRRNKAKVYFIAIQSSI